MDSSGEYYLKYGSTVLLESKLNSTTYDGVLLITYPNSFNTKLPSELQKTVELALQLDQGLQSEVSVLQCANISGSKLIVSPTGPIGPYDDVRSVVEAAKKGTKRALVSGVKNLLVIVQGISKFKQNALSILMGVLDALYVPIQVREFYSLKSRKFNKLGIFGENVENLEAVIKNAIALENGRIAARDVAGGDPERMCPPKVEQYAREQFKNYPNIKIDVISDLKSLETEFPLFAAVNRAANEIERHKGRVIFITYSPPDASKIKDTVILVGKGVTYDTGGADIKAGGHMAGMSRDKSGAGAVIGFLRTCAELKPTHLKVIGIMSMVRNSVGENCYVSDELLVSRSEKLVRIGNTDAEGRMVMADVVCMMKEKAKAEINPHIYTIATLTGHSIKAMGEGYSVVLDNHVARREGHAKKLQESGDSLGDMFEISVLRREDFALHRGRFEGDDVWQSNTEPSTAVPRGHQGPAAFLIIASGLEGEEIKFSHIDMAPSAGIAPKEPTASPLLALAQLYNVI